MADPKFRVRNSPGFTIVELLVVIGIIAVLVSILLPTMQRMREHAAAVKCQSNLRTLSSAFIAFAADHDGALPGSSATNGDPDPDHHDWILDTTVKWQTGPQGGTLWKYVNSTEAYRCSLYAPEAPGSGSGSNGHFDYCAFACFAGASLRLIEGQSRLQLPNGTYPFYPTPLLCQEDPKFVNGSNPEGRHSQPDQMGHMHRGGNYVGAVDGSAYWVIEDETGSTSGTYLWSCKGPASHNWVTLNNDNGYGQWNQQ